jgi:hypothetical protein
MTRKQEGERFPGDKNVLCSLFGEIVYLSDLDYQERIWVRDEGPDFGTFAESVSRVFDDGQIERMVTDDGLRLGLSPAQRDQLRAFATTLDRFIQSIQGEINKHDESWVLRNPGWKVVVASAGVTVAVMRPWFDSHCDPATGYAKPEQYGMSCRKLRTSLGPY